MTVGALNCEIFIPASRSLKEKRRVLQGLIQRLRHRFNVAVAEVEFQETWQRAGLGISTVGSSEAVVRRTLETIVEQLRTGAEFALSQHEIELF